MFADVAKCITGQLLHMQCAGVGNINGHRSDSEDIILITKNMLICPNTKSTVFRETVAAYAGAGENHIAVGGSHLDSLDDLDQINAVALCKEAPFVKESEDGG